MKEKNLRKPVCIFTKLLYLCNPKVLKHNAEVAQLVEHHLAKVRVAGSSLVFRSKRFQTTRFGIFYLHTSLKSVLECPGGGTGRRAGLKILFAAMQVRVQVPPGAHREKTDPYGSVFS